MLLRKSPAWKFTRHSAVRLASLDCLLVGSSTSSYVNRLAICVIIQINWFHDVAGLINSLVNFKECMHITDYPFDMNNNSPDQPSVSQMNLFLVFLSPVDAYYHRKIDHKTPSTQSTTRPARVHLAVAHWTINVMYLLSLVLSILTCWS